jgi:tetratricopeptide (TPR) repeat protein
VTPEKLDQAKEALEQGKFDQALLLIAEAQAERPDDAEVRGLFAATHLARAIRLSNDAREARRQELRHREIEYEQEFQDTQETAQEFERALAAIEEVLRVDPGHSKARMLKAALVFRQDRESGRPKALEILRQLAADEPGNRQVAFTIRKIERSCERCGDTGFCPHCKGRGERKLLRMTRRCEACYGRGICPVCGVL